MWFKSRRKRESEAAWARFSGIADQIGARDGQLVSETREGGLVVPDGLGVITIRPGSAQDVARAQLEAVVAAGYQGLLRPPCDSAYPCGFRREEDQSMLTMWTFPAGSMIRGTDVMVPAGHTAVVISID